MGLKQYHLTGLAITDQKVKFARAEIDRLNVRDLRQLRGRTNRTGLKTDLGVGLINIGQPGQFRRAATVIQRSEEHTSELQSRGHLVCRLLLEKKHGTL